MSRPEQIPRVIHYCWFSGKDIPPFLGQCIHSWTTAMPDYTLRLWNADSFDFASVPFVKEAFDARKWAFVADYIRLHALYHEGGIYLDSDVRVFRRFDDFLGYEFFTSHEIHPHNFTDVERRKLDPTFAPREADALIYGHNVQAAIMGGAKGNAFLKACLDFYADKHLAGPDGVLRCNDFIIGPHISKIAEQFGYRYHAGEQRLRDNMIILRPEVFVGNDTFLRADSYASHLCNGSWKTRSRYEDWLFRVRNRVPTLFRLLLRPISVVVSKMKRAFAR